MLDIVIIGAGAAGLAAARRLQDRVTMGRLAWLGIAISTAALMSTKAPGESQQQVSNDAFDRGRLIASGGGPGGAAAACFTCHGINGVPPARARTWARIPR